MYVKPITHGIWKRHFSLQPWLEEWILLRSLFPCQPPSQFMETTHNFYLFFFNSEFFWLQLSAVLDVTLSPLIETSSLNCAFGLSSVLWTNEFIHFLDKFTDKFLKSLLAGHFLQPWKCLGQVKDRKKAFSTPSRQAVLLLLLGFWCCSSCCRPPTYLDSATLCRGTSSPPPVMREWMALILSSNIIQVLVSSCHFTATS